MGPSLMSPSLWSLTHKHGLCFQSFSGALQEGPQVLGVSRPNLMVWAGVSINKCTDHSNRFCKTSIWEGERDLIIGYQECTLSLLA